MRSGDGQHIAEEESHAFRAPAEEGSCYDDCAKEGCAEGGCDVSVVGLLCSAFSGLGEVGCLLPDVDNHVPA